MAQRKASEFVGPPEISTPPDINIDRNSRDMSLDLIGYEWGVARTYSNHSSATSARSRWVVAHGKEYEFLVRGNEILARKKN